jgi:hypothetical protein
MGRACNPVLSGNLLGVEWVYRPWGKRERGMLVIDWRKQLYVIFDYTTVSLTVINPAIFLKLSYV